MTIKKDFKSLIGKEILFFDGAMGTMLQKNGLCGGDIPEIWNFTKPDIIQKIHTSYLEAGSNIISTNAFGAHPEKLEQDDYSCEEIIKRAVFLAKESIEIFSKNQNPDIQPLLACGLGPSGHLLKPLGSLSFEKSYEGYKRQAVAAEEAGSDLILLETMTDTYEIKSAVLAIKENTNLPVIASSMVDERGHLLTGGDIDSLVSLLEGLRVDAIGLNCGFGPDQLKGFTLDLLSKSSLPVMLNSNAGMPEEINGKTVWGLEPLEYARRVCEIAKEGLHIIGGCCGTTPDHIKALVKEYYAQNIKLKKTTKKDKVMVSSGSKTVFLNNEPILIGEKLNPSGNRQLKNSILTDDKNYSLKLAQRQGKYCKILDLNMSINEKDEISLLSTVLKDIQAIENTPIMLDSANPKALEKAARIYNGKPFINSVSGKQSSLDSVLPIAAKYGGVLIALTLNDNGIPKTPEDRVEIAEKIVNEGRKYGLSKEDFIIDPLVLTVSSNQQEPSITLKSIRLLNKKGFLTSIGLSNVSFGLPQREYINSTFFAMCLEEGLSCAIVNPFSKEIQRVHKSYLALKGLDKGCENYIQYAVKHPISHDLILDRKKNSKDRKSVKEMGQKDSVNNEDNLKASIVNGLRDKSREDAKFLLETINPLEIINDFIVPALEIVGENFEKGRIYLPQLLASADAAQSAFSIIKELVPASKASSKGRILLATVKGDIHDIGKNIVKVLLENYGYDILDLGKDVKPEIIVATAKNENIKLIGLSALMTTTVPYMKETIELARKEELDCKIAVGGAVLTEKYSRNIGADAYCKDAMSTVRYAKTLDL